METRIATGIDTELFYSIIKYLTKTGWRVSLEYSTKLFDKGIDFDLYQLNKNGETIKRKNVILKKKVFRLRTKVIWRVEMF